MEFEIKRIKSNIHVNINGVVSAAFARRCKGDGWVVLIPQIAQAYDTLEDALAIIAAGMDTWYTIAQAAARLAELGVYDNPPSAHTLANLARAGAFLGAFKLRGRRGSGGRGGSWRIPEAALRAFAERRKEQ